MQMSQRYKLLQYLITSVTKHLTSLHFCSFLLFFASRLEVIIAVLGEEMQPVEVESSGMEQRQCL